MSALALNRDHLTIFVVGPGEGEALAVWLPGNGWLFVDACRRSFGSATVVPQIGIMKLAPDASTWGVVLTHPHEDHVEGFPDLIAAGNPQRVFVTGTDAPSRNLVSSVESSLLYAAENDTKRRGLAKAVHAAAVAIRGWEAANGRAVVGIHEGSCLLNVSDIKIECIAPDPSVMGDMLADARPHELASKANYLSAVLAVTFGSARVLLTGDLPWIRTGATVPPSGDLAVDPVSSGWETVASRHSLTHHALKVPHHASREALHPKLLASANGARTWVVTPKNRSGLPKFWGTANGLDTLLAVERQVFVTSVPSAWQVPAPLPPNGAVSRAALRRRTAAVSTTDAFADAGDDIRPPVVDPHETIWAFSIDDRGNVHASRGTEAITVER